MDRIKWIPTSSEVLENFEKEVLSYLKTPYEGKYVDIGSHLRGNEECKIWTISMNKDLRTEPLVLVHGLGSGLALWALSLDTFSATRPVYGFDILGLGRSSRPKFSSDGPTAETELIDSIEKWRIKMNLEKFILCGHSFGGYLSTCYALKYPERISHLILEDPFGFPEKPKENLPFWLPVLKLAAPFNPYAILRVSGPLGPMIINTLSSGLAKKFHQYFDQKPEKSKCVSKYIYHCNVQNPSGEEAFHSLQVSFGWAKNPLINRLQNLSASIPLTIIYGSKSWLPNCSELEIREKRTDGSYTDIQTIMGAGHQLHIQCKSPFNEIVLKACEMTSTLSNTSRIETKLKN